MNINIVKKLSYRAILYETNNLYFIDFVSYDGCKFVEFTEYKKYPTTNTKMIRIERKKRILEYPIYYIGDELDMMEFLSNYNRSTQREIFRRSL